MSVADDALEYSNFEVPVSFHAVVSSELFVTRRHICCNAVVASKVFSAGKKIIRKVNFPVNMIKKKKVILLNLLFSCFLSCI